MSAQTESHPVSFAQDALFYANKCLPSSSVHNIRLICRVKEHVDAAMLRTVLDQVVVRHPVLRTSYKQSEDVVSQRELSTGCDFRAVDARQWSPSELEARIEQDGCIPFDLANGEVFRVRLYALEGEESSLLLCAHEIAADVRSLEIVASDVAELYSALCEGRAPQLPSQDVSYFDYAREQRSMLHSERGRRLIDACRSRYSQQQIAVLDLPLDRVRSREIPAEEASVVSFRVEPELGRKLQELAGQEKTDRYSLFLAAYAILLGRYGNTQNVLIGSSATTRTPEVSGVAGNFSNLVPVAAECKPELEFRTFLAQVADSVRSAREQQELPFSMLVQNLSLPVEPGRAPLCDAYFICEQERSGSERPSSGGGIDIQVVKAVDPVYGPFDIALRVPGQDACEGSVLYRSDLFDAGTIERMSRHFVRLLESIVSNPGEAISKLELMPDDERALVLGAYAGDSADYPHLCLHELFAQHASLRPQAEAVVFGDVRLTYGELDLRSNQVARFLRTQGLSREELVGIFMDRSADMIVAMLGILKAGGVYVPIDPEYPAERLQFLLEDTTARLILTNRQVKTTLPGAATLVYVDGDDSPIAKVSTEPVPNIATPDSIAVLIYTSGSTGRPKGACIPHRAAVRTVRNTNYMNITPEDRVGQCSSPSFDAAIMEVWSALVNGAALVCVPRETLLTPSELVNALRRERITTLTLNTAYLHQIGREAPGILANVRYVVFGGEAAEPGPIREILKHGPPGALINGYGPAEGCVITTYHQITSVPENARTVLIGRPVTNAQVYLLDSNMRPVPLGVVGEIFIGGEGVARGYWRRPDLNAEKFVADVFSNKPGAVLYRTGDLARMRGNGQMEFVGRIDHQVKIRGYRIELPEVQMAVASHPDVKQAFVMLREDQPGDKRLVAYVKLHQEMASAPEVLRQHVKDKLPPYMVPASFVVVDEIVLTTNGKVDRSALPPPNDRPDMASAYAPANTGLEQKLTGMWEELLGVDKVGIHDNFFNLGGHSLLASRLIARIEKETGHNIPVATLFEAPTISELARKLEDRTYASAWSPLIQLHEGNGDNALAPFFCIHSLGANLVSFHHLAKHLRGDRPVYGLQPHGLDGRQAPLDSVKDMAAAYLQAIRMKQPHGPYYLGGICLGGVVAYEMAQQLAAAGEETRLLVLIDSFMPGSMKYMHARPNLVEYLDRHLGEMLLLPALSQIKYVARWAANGGTRLAWYLGWRERGSLATATQRVGQANASAVLKYKPQPYDGKVTQLMCGDGPHRSYEDRRLAWSTLAGQGIELHMVPGNHLSMVEEPNIQVMAEKLQLCLDRASVQPGCKPRVTSA